MPSGITFRILLMVGFALAGWKPAISATVLLHNEPDALVGEGSGADGGGMLDGTVQFSTIIVTNNSNDQDSAFFQTSDNVIRTWIEDLSDNQLDWNSTFQIEFQQPINGVKIVPNSPQNNSDSVIWNVGWTGSSNQAAFTNSPNTVNEYSLYENGSRLADGPYLSETPFRFDDDETAGADSNGTNPNDLNIGIPSSPWSIDLPNAVTSLTIQARVASGGTINMSREGLGVDFSGATVVPEPSNLPLLVFLLPILIGIHRHRRTQLQ